MVLVAGIMYVRNEVDTIRVNVIHHHHQGIRHLMIVDDGSSDGTFEELEELEREGLITLFHHSGGFAQAAWTNRLAHQARIDGAAWVVPLDADEFWLAPGSTIQEVLTDSPEEGMRVAPIAMVQHRKQTEATTAGLLRILHRPMAHFTGVRNVQHLVMSHQIAHCEVRGVPKWIYRPAVDRHVEVGSHVLSGNVIGPLTNDIICLHAAIRSRQTLQRKMTDFFERMYAAGIVKGSSAWHVRRWADLLADGGEDAVDREWAANSVDDDGCLDIYGTRRLLQPDHVLYDALHPAVMQTLGQ